MVSFPKLMCSGGGSTDLPNKSHQREPEEATSVFLAQRSWDGLFAHSPSLVQKGLVLFHQMQNNLCACSFLHADVTSRSFAVGFCWFPVGREALGHSSWVTKVKAASESGHVCYRVRMDKMQPWHGEKGQIFAKAFENTVEAQQSGLARLGLSSALPETWPWAQGGCCPQHLGGFQEVAVGFGGGAVGFWGCSQPVLTWNSKISTLDDVFPWKSE